MIFAAKSRFRVAKRRSQCWAVNVKGKLALMRAALPTFRANPDGGVFLITSSIAVSAGLWLEEGGVDLVDF